MSPVLLLRQAICVARRKWCRIGFSGGLKCILYKLRTSFVTTTYFCISFILISYAYLCTNLTQMLPFQTLGGEHILTEQIDGWNFKTVQGQQLTKRQRGGKIHNTLQISPSIFSNAAFVVSAGIGFLFKLWGHTNVLHPSNIKTFRLPVAHKTVELFEPSACPFFTSLSFSLHLLFLALLFSTAKVLLRSNLGLLHPGCAETS